MYGGVRDYTEFQSQLLERWLSTDEVINQFLVHYKTGAVIPQELVAKIKKAATFNQGFGTTEYLASALMDMKLHLADPENIDVDAFERETLADLKMPSELPMRHRTPHFGHVFSGEGYATDYYGYMWADVLTADAADRARRKAKSMLIVFVFVFVFIIFHFHFFVVFYTENPLSSLSE